MDSRHAQYKITKKDTLRCLFSNWEQVDVTRTDFDIISEFLLQLIIIDNGL